jgi:hypothetical protein
MKQLELRKYMGLLAAIGALVWRDMLTYNEGLTVLVLVGQLTVFVQQRKLMAQQLAVSAEAEKRAQRHDRLSVRPFLDFDVNASRMHLKVVLENHGAGVALNLRLEITVEGHLVPIDTDEEWLRPLLRALGLTDRDLAQGREQRGYVSHPVATLRPGGQIVVTDFHFSGTVDTKKLCSKLLISAEYESLYGAQEDPFHAKVAWS